MLNQVYERDTDALMRRTRLRPLPDGRVATGEASVFGLALAGAGLAILGARANVLSASLALATLVTYLIVYTPMKRRSPASTLVGAIVIPLVLAGPELLGRVRTRPWHFLCVIRTVRTHLPDSPTRR